MEKDCGISVLCAEDDPDARTLLEKLIRHKFPGIDLYVAANGEEGISLYAQHQPDIVVTDISMPGLDGIEMTRQIRDLNPEAFVMALTAYSDMDWQSRSKGVIFNLCIPKPVQFAPFLAAVAEGIDYVVASR